MKLKKAIYIRTGEIITVRDIPSSTLPCYHVIEDSSYVLLKDLYIIENDWAFIRKYHPQDENEWDYEVMRKLYNCIKGVGSLEDVDEIRELFGHSIDDWKIGYISMKGEMLRLSARKMLSLPPDNPLETDPLRPLLIPFAPNIKE